MGGGSGKKERNGVRCTTLILIFCFHTFIVFFSHHLVSMSFYLLSHYLSSLSFSLIPSSTLHHSTSHPLNSYHLSSVPLCFCIWDIEGCFACHTTFATPFPSRSRERERRALRRELRKKRRLGGRMRGIGKRIRTGAREKENITLLSGLMNKGKG